MAVRGTRNAAGGGGSKKKGTTPSLPSEVVSIVGLANIICYDRLTADFEEARKRDAAAIRGVVEGIVVRGAIDKEKLEDIPRTYTASDRGVTAQVQLRAKGIKKLSAADATILTTHGIKLRTIPSKEVINSLYAGGAKPAEMVLVGDVINKLKKLIAENPQAGIPENLFETIPAARVPADDALFVALNLNQGSREDVLAILADIVIQRGEIPSPGPLLDVLSDKAAAILASDDNVEIAEAA